MICSMCATGADVRSRLNERANWLPKTRKKFIEVSDTLHEMCKGKTSCDCQHRKPND